MASQELLQMITRNKSCFLRKNQGRVFTTDPFSATNVPKSSDPGFTAKNATGLMSSEEPGKVRVVRKISKRTQTKNKKTCRGVMRASYQVSEVDARKARGRNGMMGRRAQRLQQVAKRSSSNKN